MIKSVESLNPCKSVIQTMGLMQGLFPKSITN